MFESSLSEQELAEVEAATPGSQLRCAREQAQLTIALVAEELKLTKAYIESLEDDDYEALPAEPYVLGYLRAYARLLKLDAQGLVESYHDYCNALLATAGHLSVNRLAPALVKKPKLKPSELNGDEGEEEAAAAKNRTGWIIAVCLLLWAAASVLMPEASAPAPASSGSMSVDRAEVEGATSIVNQPASEVAPVADAATTNTNLTTAIEVDGAEAESATLLVAADEVSSQNVSDRLAGLDTLQLDFLDECWLEVTDSRGDVLNADLYQAGDSQTLQGKAPFNVMLGNVRAVSARLNDELLELNPNGFRKTLRLRIASTSDIEVISSRPNTGDE